MYKSLPKTRHQTRTPHAGGADAVLLSADKGAKFEPFYTAGPISTDRCRLVPPRRFDQKR
jgi:hypothetical protein